VFSRQVILGDALDADGIAAAYDAGVLRLTIPVAEKAKPRKIVVATADQAAVGESQNRQVISTTAEDRQPVSV
jgi:HSP20 family protein